MPKRPQARSAAAGSDADAKKAKPRLHVCTLAITIPHNTEPESRKLDAQHESKRAARKADENATEVLHIKQPRGAGSEAVRGRRRFGVRQVAPARDTERGHHGDRGDGLQA